MYEQLIRPVLFGLSAKDAERAHTLTVRTIQLVQKSKLALRLIEKSYNTGKQNPVTVAGLTFPNRVGLAAGFDKQAQMLPFMQALGFGFVEVGTVPPLPQVGNPRPRLFRLPEHQALCNRMGFNSHGGAVVTERLAAVRSQIRIPIGISLGKQKDTPLDDAVQDYVAVMEMLHRYVDYYAVNVSSPNTKDLRKLQGRAYLEHLVRSVVETEREYARSEGRPEKPTFVKIAPDLTDVELAESLEASENGGASGIIATNTTLVHPLGFDPAKNTEISGGFSGAYTFLQRLALVQSIRRQTKCPLIACGGIWEPAQVRILLDEGVDLFQIFTSLVYRGPGIVPLLKKISE